MRVLPLLLALGACAPGPHKVLTDYLAAEQSGRYDAAWDLLTPSDQGARPLDAYVAEHLSAGPIWLAVAKRTRFELGDPASADGGVTVPVTATHADLAVVAEKIAPPPADRLAAAEDPDAFRAAWIESEVGRQAFPAVDEHIAYTLRQEDAGWRVWLGLDRQDAALAALRAADVAGDRGDAVASRAALERLLALPQDPSGVVAALQAEARQRIAALDAAGR